MLVYKMDPLMHKRTCSEALNVSLCLQSRAKRPVQDSHLSCDLNSEIQIDKARLARTDSASQGELFVPVTASCRGFLSIRQE